MLLLLLLRSRNRGFTTTFSTISSSLSSTSSSLNDAAAGDFGAILPLLSLLAILATADFFAALPSTCLRTASSSCHLLARSRACLRDACFDSFLAEMEVFDTDEGGTGEEFFCRLLPLRVALGEPSFISSTSNGAVAPVDATEVSILPFWRLRIGVPFGPVSLFLLEMPRRASSSSSSISLSSSFLITVAATFLFRRVETEVLLLTRGLLDAALVVVLREGVFLAED
mmetsp:Transcript_7371/g.8522  ORF Transcript_7371/g.8522 Transcript_7371/m.8522 type:complete len:227 (+) Transcript_7371:1307-1987(+)